MAWMLVAFIIPFLVTLVRSISGQLLHPSLTSVGLLASAAAVVVAVGQYAIVPLLAWRERRLRRAGVL